MNITKLLLDTYFGDQDSILVLGDFCEENNIYFQGLVNADVEESLYSNRYDYNSYGNGYGTSYGNGNGYGDGYGDGNGYGTSYGYGNGNGYGDGNGNGYGNGNGLKEFYL